MSKAVGFIDAYKDKDFLNYCFIPTQCYKDSIADDIHFICGRRGTGKSAIVLNLYNNEKYIYRDHVEGPQFYQQFIDSLKPSAFEDLNTNLLFMTIWKHLILITGMNAIIQTKYPKVTDYISSEDKPMYDFLKAKEFLGKKPLSLWQRIINSMKETISKFSKKDTFLSEMLKQLTSLLENDDFFKAEASLKKHLTNHGKCLVIIDTILDFFQKEEMFLKCVEGLILAVLSLSCKQYHKNFEVKCCIPGEIYPRIKMWEKAKVNDHLVKLQWSPKDLIRMISKRLLYRLIILSIEKETTIDEIDWENYQTIKNFVWDKYFPKEIVNKKNIVERTHVYILRHTQHSPREMIRIVNNVIKEIGDNFYTGKRASKFGKELRKGVYLSCIETSEELVDSNQYLIPELDNILSSSFQSKAKFLSVNDVRSFLGHSKKYWRSHQDIMEEDTIIKELFSVGFFGLVLNIDSNSMAMKTKFSYLDPNIGLSKDCILAVHPLFYEKYNIDTKDERFVYPISYLADEWDNIESVADDTEEY